MQKKRSKQSKFIYYSNIMIVSAITLIVYGVVLNFTSGTNLLAPFFNSDKEGSINITTNDGSLVVPEKTPSKGNNVNGSLGGNTSSVIPDGPSSSDNNGSSGGGSLGGNTSNSTGSSSNNGSSGNSGSNSGSHSNGGSVPSSSSQQSNVPSGNTTPPAPATPTIEETNNSFRNTLQSNFNITIKYGGETNGYTVGGLTTVPITDPYVINSSLNKLNSTLSKYPKGLFSEIKSGGIPLTIILINNYSNNSVTGVTDSNFSFANISIAVSHPFEESFFHESYHYIERYIFKRGGNFSSWDSLNPQGFVYNQNISNLNSYANTFSATAPFVNTYAQTAATEDRASTFEYMMASSKAGCFAKDTTVWRKASMISNMIDVVLGTVSPNVIEYWERHL